jgi:hypothetical protein
LNAQLDLIAEELNWRDAGDTDLEDFDWSVRVRNTLSCVGINSLHELVELTPGEITLSPTSERRAFKRYSPTSHGLVCS